LPQWSGAFADRAGAVANRSGVIADRAGVIADRAGVIANRSGVIANRSGIVAGLPAIVKNRLTTVKPSSRHGGNKTSGLRAAKGAVMSKNKTIPDSDAELAVWGGNLSAKVSENAEPWEIPAAEAAALQASYGAFMGLYTQTSAPGRNKILTEAKNEARDIFKAKARIMINFRLKNPIIPRTGLVEAGVAVGDTSHTPVGEPEEHVGLTIMPINVRQHKIVWTVEETGSRAIPKGYSGVVLRKGVLEPDAPLPAKPEDLPSSNLVSRNNLIINFRAEDQGKRCVYAACWQTKTGLMGPWTDLISIIVP
jgi:hypothetical protein